MYGNVPCCALCFAWDALGSGLLLGAAAMDEAAFKAWLGVEVETASGYRYALPGRVCEVLLAAFVAKDVDMNDVIQDGAQLDEAEMGDLRTSWLGYYTDALNAASGKEKSVEKSKLSAWLKVRFFKDETTPKKLDVATPSAAAREDMTAQGASELWQLGFVELALATGRAPAREECEGYAYRAPWNKMLGGKAAYKFKEVTLDGMLAKADSGHESMAATVAAVDIWRSARRWARASRRSATSRVLTAASPWSRMTR